MDEDMRRYVAEAEIARLITAYWDEVDARWGANAHAFFTEDATFQKMKGKAEIKAFYDWRKSRGERVAFHLVSNLKVMLDDSDRASARYVMTLYAADGAPPRNVQGPASVSDVTETFLRDAGGDWKIASKTMRLVFKGDEPTTIMPDEILASLRQSQPAN